MGNHDRAVGLVVRVVLVTVKVLSILVTNNSSATQALYQWAQTASLVL